MRHSTPRLGVSVAHRSRFARREKEDLSSRYSTEPAYFSVAGASFIASDGLFFIASPAAVASFPAAFCLLFSFGTFLSVTAASGSVSEGAAIRNLTVTQSPFAG